MSVTIAPCGDVELLIRHYELHWREISAPDWDVRSDWAACFRTFVAQVPTFRAFGAHVDGTIVGTACCHELGRAFPAFRTFDADRLGYIWSVFVDPGARGRGIGRALVQAALDHLKQVGCGRMLLHAGDEARPLYERLGFFPTEEMAIDAGDF